MIPKMFQFVGHDAAKPTLVKDDECLLVRLCPSCSKMSVKKTMCACSGGWIVEPFATLDELKAKAK
jgi:hypothetical protein